MQWVPQLQVVSGALYETLAACLPACLYCLQTLVNEGMKGVYKGFSAPLATVALFNAVLFASRGQMEVLLKHHDGGRLGVRHLSGQVSATASLASICACVEGHCGTAH